MSGTSRRVHDIKCDGCGKESTLLAASVVIARERMRHGGWRYYKKGNAGYDKCPKCKPPQGKGWESVY